MTKGSKSPYITITPLGGVGEIGSNCTIIENETEMVIVDYGILFPYEDFFDINYLIVPLEKIKDTEKKVTVFITHGHEDHIGAIVHLNQVFPNAQIHAPKFAEKLMRRKLQNAGQAANIAVYTTETVLEFSNFNIHPIQVTHSIPDTYGLVISAQNKSFSALFISDFKYDLNPLYEVPFEVEKIKKLFSQTHKNYCFMDSTNILKGGKTPSERDLTDDLGELVKSNNRVFITLFSSNIHRLRTIFILAQEAGKRVVPIGRSIKHYIESAKECGLFGDELSILRSEAEVKDPKSNKFVYILTGCQGDHFGALRRVATGEHKFLKPDTGDLFIFSSKPIPGNEKKIYRLYNTLTESGAEVVTSSDKLVHASGHPGKEDLRQLYKELSPDVIIPIHGESYFLKKHCEFIEDEGFGKSYYLNNYDKAIFSANGEIETDHNPKDDPVIIHGKSIPLEREAISKRRKVACNGSCFISIDSKSRKLSLTTLGLPVAIEDDLQKITNLIKGQLGKKLMQRDHDFISEEIRIFTRNLFQNFLGYKPVTTVHIL